MGTSVSKFLALGDPNVLRSLDGKGAGKGAGGSTKRASTYAEYRAMRGLAEGSRSGGLALVTSSPHTLGLFRASDGTPTNEMLYAVAGGSALAYMLLRRYFRSLIINHKFLRFLPPPTREAIELHLLSLINAVIMTGYAVVKLTATRRHNTTPNLYALAAMLGYFVHDFAVGLPTALSHKADMVHHLAGISIIANCFRVRQLLHHVPALTVLEISTIPLNVMWICREVGMQDTMIGRRATGSFIALFVLGRVLWFGYYLWRQERSKNLRKYKGTSAITALRVAYGLQIYWLALIVRKMVRAR